MTSLKTKTLSSALVSLVPHTHSRSLPTWLSGSIRSPLSLRLAHIGQASALEGSCPLMHDKHSLTQVLSSQSPAWMLENKLSGSHICFGSYSIPRGCWDPSIMGCIYLCLNFRVSISTLFWSKTFPLSCDIWGTFSWRADLQGPHFLRLSPKVMWTRAAEHCIQVFSQTPQWGI